MYYNIIHIFLIISNFVCQHNGKKYILQTKNENGESKHVEDGESKPVEDGESEHVEDGESEYVEDGESEHVEDGESEHVEKTNLSESFEPDYMAGAATCPSGYFGEPPSCSCFEDNTAYYENNVQMGEKNLQPSRLACQQSCSDHSECEFWTWAKKTTEGEGPCYLKHTRENVSPGLNGYISGSKQCLLPEANGQEKAETELHEDRNAIGKLNEGQERAETELHEDRNAIGKLNEGERIFFEIKPEFTVSWNNLLGELTYLYKYFNITFDLLINKLTGGSFQSIIHFSTGGFDDAHEQYGDRCPAVWLKFDDDRFKLFVESAISGERKMNRKINKKQLKEGEWMKIEISQTMDKENKYYFELKVDGQRYWNIENRKPADFEHVKIYAGNWYKTVDGRIRNVTVETVDAEYRLKHTDKYGHG